jgi:dCTP diphosphatase
MAKKPDIADLSSRIGRFCDERDWNKYHNPKNLSMSVAIEAAELMEIFQWLTLDESSEANLDDNVRQDVEDEIADIIIYCIRMSQVLHFDLLDAIKSKIDKNEIKYPVDKIKGKSRL